MLILGRWSIGLLLFALWYISFRQLGIGLLRRKNVRARLTAGRKRSSLQERFLHARWVLHVSELLEVSRLISSLRAFFTISFLMALGGLSFGALFFQSVRGVLLLTPMLAVMPYGWLKLRLISRQLKNRLEFLPAVEVFYQYYLMESNHSVRRTLQSCLSGDRLLYPAKSSFAQLQRSLSAGKDAQAALRLFSLEFGHVWASYFADMLRIGMEEGVDLSSAFQELIQDMRRAQLFDQRARNRLLEIRLASFSPGVFLFLFIGINFKLNTEQSYSFYVRNPMGRDMLLNALLLMTASFLMGIYLSLRRM